jgi:hypothetical protein
VTRTATKERERALLEVVYTADEAARFAAGERPDFTSPVLGDESKRFGVEVTEFYLSESHARLRRLPGYVAELFAGRYRHANDRHELPVETVTLRPHAGGGDRELAALIQRFPETPEHLRLLAATISDKACKASRYKRLHHLNLILVDRLQRWGKLESGSLCKLLTSQHIPAAIWRAPFHEIFYVTALGDRWVYLPLVMHCIMAELFGFALVLGPHLPEKPDQLVAVLQAFGHHLRRRSRGGVLARGDGEAYEILHRRYGVLLSDAKGVVVHDYLDFSYPGDARELDEADPLPLSRRITAQRLRRYHDTHSFECDVVAVAKAVPPA